MLQIINPIEYPNWDDLLLTNENASFFHTSGWARVISESHKYQPLYFTEIENDKLTALIPIMEIKSLLTGKRGVALPFTDFCPIISSNENNFKELFAKIIEYGKNAKWKGIEFKGGKKCLNGQMPSETFLTHVLDLSQSEQKIFSRFRSSTKRNIKKANDENLRIEILNSMDSVKAFYKLHCITRKKHGLPVQPFIFFRKLYEYIISKNKALVVLGIYRDKVVAGAIYSHFGNKAIFKFGASDKAYHHLRPNNLVMWEAIKWYAQHGYKQFSLGRTEPENQGLLQFKRGWGTREEIINYYKYDIENDSFVTNSSRIKLFNTFLQNMPIPLLKLTGRLLYRHVG